MSRVPDDVSCDLDPKVKVKGQIMYFLKNASPHNLLEVATSNYTRFFVRKIGYINFVPKSVRRPSVRASVCPSVRHISCNCIFS